MKRAYSPFIIAAAVAVLLITGNTALSQTRDMPMQGHGGGHGQQMDAPAQGHGAGHGPAMDMPMKGHGAGHGQMGCDMGMRGHGGHGAGHGQQMTGRRDKMGDMIDMCLQHAETIGLTADQVGKIKRLHREIQKKQARFRADLTVTGIDLREIMEVKDFDLGKASAATTRIADIKTAHHLEMLKALKEIRTLLTDEQFKKMTAIMGMKMHRRDR